MQQEVYKVPVTITRGESMQSLEGVGAMCVCMNAGGGTKRIA